jgi:Spy/CpxP family protein refolding chaperone
MHAGFIPWWRRAHFAHEAHAGCGEFAGGPGGEWRAHGFGHHGDDGGGSFGVRRPLRFLAYKLDLNEAQTTELAKILDDLKTERAQAAVDDRRSVAAFAEAVAGASFDAAKAQDAAKARTDTADRLAKAVSAALAKIHAVLEPEQRERLSYLVRTGTLSL